MSSIKATSTDIIVFRQYQYRGITVTMVIDFLKGKCSIVTPDPDGDFLGFTEKQYVFAGRDVPYMKKWLFVLRAIEHATKEGIKELERYKKQQKGKK